MSNSSLTRRDLLRFTGGALLAGVSPASLRAADVRFREDPFTLGVASGYPTTDSVVLWTRLAPTPFEPGGGVARDAIIPVQWELATDERMRNVVRTGVEYASAEWAHSVHVEPAELESGREYWYRFTAGKVRSPVGRTRIAPAAGAESTRMRVALASCQQYEHGYFNAYRHMLDDELDLILHVGDYIYEQSWGLKRIRTHNAPEIHSLDDYRARYALYRGERELQQAHAACPWLVTWDDHEVSNDYAGDTSEQDDPRDWFLARRAVAYQAFYEHMPVPRRALPFGHELRLFAQRSFGQLANVFMLDTRQFRSPLACTEPGRRSARGASCEELRDPSRTKLGSAQEGWLAQRMAASRSRWNLICSGTVMAYVDEQPGAGERFWNDSWNGYPAARARLMESMAAAKLSNPVLLSGDIHTFLAANHHRTPHDLDSPRIAVEFTTSSITSQGISQPALDERRANNPNLVHADSTQRGYVRLDITPKRLQADLVALDSVIERQAGRSVQASFVVEDGSNVLSS